ncbi:hypothetical protein VK792_12090 [Mesobacterium sp. TK19101]|uniref:Uncharacterized protein n=1 Tax=Mesobacterium hydrothermale TaxID=3111907 RepID=A0ABU6HI05_9RHOB|nr:hypothetical protein [Mesobacterium sp. TK19101]MEC3862027.1 hypothetical protein [Mesobacterium sp. TK19101]
MTSVIGTPSLGCHIIAAIMCMASATGIGYLLGQTAPAIGETAPLLAIWIAAIGAAMVSAFIFATAGFVVGIPVTIVLLQRGLFDGKSMSLLGLAVGALTASVLGGFMLIRLGPVLALLYAGILRRLSPACFAVG